jgi:hypothetical protein
MQKLLTSVALGFALFSGYQSPTSTLGPSARPRR